MSQINNKRILDPSEFTDYIGSKELVDASNRMVHTYDAYGDLTEFDVVVLSQPLPIDSADAQAVFGDSLTWTTSEGAEASGFYFNGRIKGVGFYSPHEILPDPCYLPAATDAYTTARLISMHTTFISAENADIQRVPKIGDVCTVNFNPGDFKLDMQQAYFKKIRVSSNDANNVKVNVDCQRLVDKLSDFDPNSTVGNPSSIGTAVLGSASSTDSGTEKLIKFIDDIQAVESGLDLTGTEFPDITTVAEKEISTWNGKKETDPEMYAELKKYYDNAGFEDDDWTVGTAWSAVFVSWVVNQADPTFPAAIGHYFYIAKAKKEVGNWSAWNMTKSAGRIKAQVGDVVVKRRKPDKNNPDKAMHGDVVYKIVDNNAYLIGGNTGAQADTAKKVYTMKLTDGYYDSLKSASSKYPYEVVLKKNPVLLQEGVPVAEASDL